MGWENLIATVVVLLGLGKVTTEVMAQSASFPRPPATSFTGGVSAREGLSAVQRLPINKA